MSHTTQPVPQYPGMILLEHFSEMELQLDAAISAIAANSLSAFESSLWQQEMLCTVLRRSVVALHGYCCPADTAALLRASARNLLLRNRVYEALIMQSKQTISVLNDLCELHRRSPAVQPGIERLTLHCSIMIGLNGSLSIAENALAAQYAGLAVTNNNIANVNTAGYSRQVVTLSSVAYAQNGVSVDGGVTYSGYTSVRDNVLNLAINSKTSDQSSLNAQNSILTQINSDFSGTTTGIGADISSLFSHLSALSTTPSDASARQTVLTSANQLVNDFHQGAASLSNASNTANQQVVSTVTQINQLTQQIASLNGQLAQIQESGQDGGSLEDQRDGLTNQLAQLTGISSTQTDTTPTLTTANGSPLVIGNTAYALQIATGSDGTVHILDAQGADITAQLTSGTLGGAITTRDNTLPEISQQLDTLASQFANAMNVAQTSGFDLNGNPGTAMFTVPPGGTGAAAGIALTLTSTSGLAISSDGSGGSSGNLQEFLGVQNNALSSGSTPGDAYANLVNSIGTAASLVNTSLTATTASLSQLTTQRDSESGVSVDEESVNLIRYQQAYTAAAKVISALDGLFSTVMNMDIEVTP